jgi:hypothetical protein
MRTTTISLKFNMGLTDKEDEEEKKTQMRETDTHYNVIGLGRYMTSIMPTVDELELASQIHSIEFKTLELGQWASCDHGTWAQPGVGSPMRSYNMHITVSIQHEHTLTFPTMANIIDAIYDNGANRPYTPDAADDTLRYNVLYPYNSSVSHMYDGICVGHASDDEM